MQRESDLFVQDETFGSVACQYRYNNRDHIAKGAFGSVYQATITNRGDFLGAEHVAVKIIHFDRPPESATERTKWVELRQRLQNLRELRCDHLVAYHKITITKGSLGGISIELMMDYHNGGDLSKLLRNLRQQKSLMSEADAVSYTIQTAEGLQFLHDKQIIHGDLKPSNILTTLSQNGDRKLAICDLDDIIPMEQDATCSRDITHLRGTYRYMSPEMLKKFFGLEFENPGRKTDMWSLGCIMLELADCVVGNDQKWLRKEHQKLEFGNKVDDGRFIQLILDGYVPCPIETIPSCLTANLQQCLHTKSSGRISASLLIQQLKAREFIMIFRYRRKASQCYVLDPRTKSATELTLPVDLYKLNVVAVSNCNVVCQAVFGDSREVLLWDVQKQNSPTVLFPGRCRLSGLMLCPIAIMDKIYFWYEIQGSVQFRMLDLRAGRDVILKLPRDFSSRSGRLYGAKDGNRIIFIGENRDEKSPSAMWVKCFNTVTGEWDSLPDLPARRHSFAIVVLQKTVYVLGGYVDNYDDTNLRSCLRLDLQSPTRQWKKMCDLMAGRARHCAFTSDNMIHVFGKDMKHVLSGGRPGKVAASGIMEVYDAERDLWSNVSVAESERFFVRESCWYVAANVVLNWPVSGLSQ